MSLLVVAAVLLAAWWLSDLMAEIFTVAALVTLVAELL